MIGTVKNLLLYCCRYGFLRKPAERSFLELKVTSELRALEFRSSVGLASGNSLGVESGASGNCCVPDLSAIRDAFV